MYNSQLSMYLLLIKLSLIYTVKGFEFLLSDVKLEVNSGI